ncbi:phasin family protein [Pseudomonas sp. MYb185]|uniref:phasin family protein n=1 Tax=Pseudomonas sp. MYb185 TaxID=1848729 RepID=UPI000CFAA6F9|nr:phasin family protein [Pseudomonas sp. MYb185]PRB83004.1 poly(3-hydroxyalkanoate) granule-associated protein PhaF [Pseudomonas sp. MYb185]
MADKKKRDEKDNWIDGLEGYSRQIWLAGLGAYTRVGKEGGKLFEALIRDGEEAEKAARTDAGRKGTRGKKDSLEAARAKVDKARSKMSDKLGGLEEMFDKRMASTVERLGLARQAELQALAARVDELTKALEQLSAAPAAAAKPARAARTSTASKPAAKSAPAAAKPAASKATKPAAKPKAGGAAAQAKSAATPAVKTTARRRSTAPKAATRGQSAPAPATQATPGTPPEL